MFRVIIFVTFITILLAGCTNSKSTEDDEYDSEREIAYEFLKEENWIDTIEGDWKEAKVEKRVASNDAEYLDSAFKGKEVLAVTFKDKPTVIASTPVVLIEPVSSKVIGYIPGE